MEGIEITEVAPGSIAAQHGVKSGDVIVSVNGTPVNSVQEAISYAKNNADIYSVWTIVVSNAGYERTIVYETE
jgi:S1-C subfamily serine protease